MTANQTADIKPTEKNQLFDPIWEVLALSS